MEIREVVENHVKDYLVKNISLLPDSIRTNERNLNHVEDIATSIMCTKWDVSYPGGSFVTALVNNKLRETFGLADDVCKNAIPFFIMMVNNLDMPREVYMSKIEYTETR